MPNEEQVEAFRRGQDAWKAWRAENRGSPVNMSGVDLSGIDARGADLSYANLAGCDFSEANLAGADLSHASLHEASFARANLTSAVLTEAFLLKASFEGATLQNADLARTHLLGVNMDGAELRGINFTEVAFWRSAFFKRDLEGARFDRAYLYKTTLAGSNLRSTCFDGANLEESNLIGADLSGASLKGADLTAATLAEATLQGADLAGATLFEANLTDANAQAASFDAANLQGAILVRTDLRSANLRSCRVYGLSAWDVQLEGAAQDDLVITPPEMPTVTVGNLAVAQFIYLLLNNASLRHVIDTIASKVVLILGRFTPERKAVLDGLRATLRGKGYSPVLFDFEKPGSRDLTETIRILAGLSRFVVADLTAAKSVPQELMAIAPGLPSVPIQPIIDAVEVEYAMFEHLRRYPWVLKLVRYASQDELLANADDLVIRPAERWLGANASSEGS